MRKLILSVLIVILQSVTAYAVTAQQSLNNIITSWIDESTLTVKTEQFGSFICDENQAKFVLNKTGDLLISAYKNKYSNIKETLAKVSNKGNGVNTDFIFTNINILTGDKVKNASNYQIYKNSLRKDLNASLYSNVSSNCIKIDSKSNSQSSTISNQNDQNLVETKALSGLGEIKSLVPKEIKPLDKNNGNNNVSNSSQPIPTDSVGSFCSTPSCSAQVEPKPTVESSKFLDNNSKISELIVKNSDGTKLVFTQDKNTNTTLQQKFDAKGNLISQTANDYNKKNSLINIDKLEEPLKSKAKDALLLSENKNIELPSEHKKSLSSLKDDSKAYLTAIKAEVQAYKATCNLILCEEKCSQDTTNLIDKIEKKLEKLENNNLNICSTSFATSKFLCPIGSSPYLAVASLAFNGLTALTANSGSAKDIVQATSTVNKVTQVLTTTAAFTCGASKLVCDTSCANSVLILGEVEGMLGGLSGLMIKDQSQMIAKAAEHTAKATNPALTAIETPLATLCTFNAGMIAKNIASIPLPTKATTNKILIAKDEVKTCKSYDGALAQMAIMASQMITTAALADKAANELGSNDPSKNIDYSMKTMCASADSANNPVCKCESNPNAVGCPGNLAASMKESNTAKLNSNAGASNMAGINKNKIITSDGKSLDMSGISLDAQKALAATSAKPNSESDLSNGKPEAAQGGGGAGGGSGGSSGSTAANGKGDENSKTDPTSIGGKFSNAVGSLFKGGFFGGGGSRENSKNGKIQTDQYQQKIQRSIANQQVRTEVSNSTGVSNWEKVKQKYKSDSQLLINN